MQRLADLVASYFVPIVILIFDYHLCRLGDLGPELPFAHALVNTESVLNIACPCTLVLQLPWRSRWAQAMALRTVFNS
jgi:Cu+-exporting ATPase